MKNKTKEDVVTLDEILKDFESNDIEEVEVADIENFNINEKFRKVIEKKSEYDQKFKNKHSAFDLFITKTKLKWYLAKEEKHTKKSSKYRKLHNSLSLAVASGFSDTKTHQTHLKNLTEKLETKNKVERRCGERTDKDKLQKLAGIK